MVPGKLGRPWLTFGIRLSVFPVTPQEAPADLWEQVVGAMPEMDQNQPRQRMRIQSGSWRGGALQLTVSSDRFVWLAGPSTTPEGFPDFENWLTESVVPDFSGIVRPWLTSVRFGVNRIGIGLHSLLFAQDRASAYRLLEELIPSVKIQPEATRDFLYQINRPKSSRVLHIPLNRLMKWSALYLGLTQFAITPGQHVQPSPVLGRQYVSLDNDVNTPAEHLEALDEAQVGAIYDELVELAWENLEAGEIA